MTQKVLVVVLVVVVLVLVVVKLCKFLYKILFILNMDAFKDILPMVYIHLTLFPEKVS